MQPLIGVKKPENRREFSGTFLKQGASQPAWPLPIFTLAPLTPWPLWEKLPFTEHLQVPPDLQLWCSNVDLERTKSHMHTSLSQVQKQSYFSLQLSRCCSWSTPLWGSSHFMQTRLWPCGRWAQGKEGKGRRNESKVGERLSGKLLPQIPCTFMLPISFRGISKPPHSEVGDLSLGVIMFVV